MHAPHSLLSAVLATAFIMLLFVADAAVGATSSQNHGRKEAVLVDSSLPGYRDLTAGVADGIVIFEFDGRKDGLAQIGQWAAGQKGLDAIHILSHGSAGVVNLGTRPLTNASLASRDTRAQLALLGRALKGGGDLLFYGCEVAAGAGIDLLQGIAQATGADVAASTDLTGAERLGGNWVLEKHIGQIEARSAFSERAMAAYDGVLLTGNGTADGTYDFGGTFGPASGGFRKIADKLKVSDFLTRDSGTTQLYNSTSTVADDGGVMVAVFKAEGGTVAKTFTFNDMAFSSFDHSRTLDQLQVVLSDVNGSTIATLTMPTTTVLATSVTRLSTLINGGAAYAYANVASVTVTVSFWKSTDHGGDGGTPGDINFESITMSNISAASANTAPVFVGTNTPLAVAQNTGATDVKGLLHVNDIDASQTKTWTQSGAPGNGTLSFTSATSTASGTDITPGGTITYTPNAGYAGPDSFTVQVSDATATATRIITVNVSPSAPGAPDLAASSDSGVNTDNLTNAASLGFSGTSASGDTLSSVRVFLDVNNNGVYDGGDLSATATVNNGAWTTTGMSTSGLADGVYNVYAFTTSSDGSLTSTRSSGLAITIDKTAPGAPSNAIVLNAGSDSGSSNSDRITSTTNPTLRVSLAGTGAVSGDFVELLLGGAALGTPTGATLTGTSISNGYVEQTVTSGDLGASGSKVFTARVTDRAGNIGSAGGALTVMLDTAAPAAPSAPQLSSASDSGASNSDRITNVTNPVITGTAEAGSRVTLYDTDGTTVLGTAVATGGTWSTTSSALAGGAHVLTATARDVAGNTSAFSGPLSVTIDTTALVFVSATPGDGKVTLTWTVTAANGSPITGYTVTGSPAGTCTTTTTSCEVSGLTNGTTHQFTVASNSGGGASAPISATPVRTEYTGTVPGVVGNASVAITGGGANCTLVSAGFNAVVPPNAPAGATQPVGVFRFRTTGCPGETLSVALTYPDPLPAAVHFFKYGPPVASQPLSWFELQAGASSLSVDRRTVTYTVTDNQAGDSDTAAGVIDDPFAPMLLLVAPAGVTAVPTLSQWGIVLMSMLLAFLAWRLRRHDRRWA